MEQVIFKLKAALQQQLPGQAAQYVMAPQTRGRVDVEQLKESQYRPSAVLMLFCQNELQQWFLPLTLRFSYKGVHSNQVSLPGGKFDATDESLQQTALRECYEEIGVKDNIEMIGPLTKLFIPVSGFLVQPFIAVCKTPNPQFTLNAREVKQLIKLQVTDLLDHAIVQNGSITIDENLSMEAPYFLSGEFKIWGATAMMLSELKALLEKTGPIF